jgi:MFS family permease
MGKIIEFLALKKSFVALLSVVILLELGERMGERFLPIYILAIGGNAIIIGLLNGMDNLLGALYSLPGGYLSDKIGYQKSLFFFNVLAVIGYLLVVFIPTWQAAILGAILFISWSSISLPAIMSAIAKILPMKKRTMGVSLHSLIRRVPMFLGPLMAGFFISYWGERDGIRLAFGLSALLAIFSIFIQQKLVAEEPPAPKSNGIGMNPLTAFKMMNPALKDLLLSDILIRFCEQIPYAFAVVWCLKKVGVSALQFGVLTTVEMITAILVYIPVAYWVEKTGKKSPFVFITFIFFTLFPLLLLLSHSMMALIFAFFVRGLKEFGEPTRKALILDLANEGAKGTIYGAYYLIRDMIVSVAAFGGGLLWAWSPTLNLLTAFAFGLLGICFYYFKDPGRHAPL